MAQDQGIVIRRYRGGDQVEVLSLFRCCTLGHIRPAFLHALRHPDNVGLALGVAVAAAVLSGGSLWVVAGACAAWVGLLLFLCWEVYGGYVRERLRSDMADIEAHFLSHPDKCFWVAEAEVAEGSKVIVGTVAVTRWSGGVAEGEVRGHGEKEGVQERCREGESERERPEQEEGRVAELFRMLVLPGWRRGGLGRRLAQTALVFCSERGYSRVILQTTSTQVAALALYRAMGFQDTLTRALPLTMRPARISVLRLEKPM
ncbi:probable N-acetyltransferase CML1 isoform X2 [Amia ocellicauda]|uniref:probable N-acetyltransferase CML1 isoform X1 n=1 Tax=Amia ocellicauda TaxID=2972642 RepID=UPI003464CD69